MENGFNHLNQSLPLPPGSIIAYAGIIGTENSSNSGKNVVNVAPYGWLVCDGSPLNISEYPALYMAIGNLYNPSTSVDGETFYLPNFQGQFLRMVNTSGSVDPDASSRKLADGTVDSGVGSFQEFAVQEHNHVYTETATQAPVPPSTLVETIPVNPQGDPVFTETALSSGATNNLESASNTVKTSTETRPMNAGIYYLIKYV